MKKIEESLSGLHTTCASCKKYCCERGVVAGDELPGNCPMRNREYMDTLFAPYTDPEVHKFYVATKTCTGTEDEHRYTPRLKSVLNLCRAMGYKRLGLAFCREFFDEAQLYASIIRRHGFEVVPVCCANGGFVIGEDGGARPIGPGRERASCNPAGQAIVMNEMKTEFNLVMGLCAGTDTVFLENSEAMCSVVFVKDPVTGHRPLSVLRYARMYPEIFTDREEGE